MGKKAQIGEIRTWSGVDYIKTANDWERVDRKEKTKKKGIPVKRDFSKQVILKVDKLTYRITKVGTSSIVETI